MANLGASLMERADVRSWHLLPQELTLIRMRAPAGARNLRLSVGGGAERVDVGAVTIRTRRMTIAAVRLWHEAPLVER